jgi:hypothetical protein
VKPGDIYRCGECRGTFETTWDDEHADAEFRRENPGATMGKLVCHDCYLKLRARTRAQCPKL